MSYIVFCHVLLYFVLLQVDVVRNSGITMDAYIVSIMIAMIRLSFTILGAGLSKQLGRRPLAIISGIGMTVSLFFLIFSLDQNTTPTDSSNINKTANLSSSNNTLLEESSDLSSISWVPLVSILFYVLSSTIGFLTLPWAMIGEVFPSQVRGVSITCF